ncbi:MAG: MBL fold metallo-hydrolase [Clostridiales bacterium]|nr:MBL fold metallo-hydrolase [Clostridiales bacterium]
MTLKTFPRGPLSSNMYLLSTASGIFIIDPSVYPDKLSSEDMPDRVDYILITHGHFDHINAIDRWVSLFPDAEVYMASEDIPALTDPYKNGSDIFVESCSYDTSVRDINELSLDNLTVIKTPGHSKGSICFLMEEDGEKIMFTGDTLFAGSCGRTDLYGGSPEKMAESLKLLKEMDPDIEIYPGHGPSSTIKDERRFNPFFNL